MHGGATYSYSKEWNCLIDTVIMHAESDHPRLHAHGHFVNSLLLFLSFLQGL